MNISCLKKSSIALLFAALLLMLPQSGFAASENSAPANEVVQEVAEAAKEAATATAEAVESAAEAATEAVAGAVEKATEAAEATAAAARECVPSDVPQPLVSQLHLSAGRAPGAADAGRTADAFR